MWAQGVTDGGSLGQLCVDREAAVDFCARLDAVSRRAIRWELVEVQATESRAAHAEAENILREIQR